VRRIIGKKGGKVLRSVDFAMGHSEEWPDFERRLGSNFQRESGDRTEPKGVVKRALAQRMKDGAKVIAA
jgi:hypothetical protein